MLAFYWTFSVAFPLALIGFCRFVFKNLFWPVFKIVFSVFFIGLFTTALCLWIFDENRSWYGPIVYAFTIAVMITALRDGIDDWRKKRNG